MRDSVKDILCFSSLSLKREEIYPCGAYIDSQGRPEDIMFDSVMFDFSGTECKMSEWENIIYALFREGENLSALDSATEDIKLFLKLPENYRVKVFIIPPAPVISREYFGDLNGDGISEKLLDVSDVNRAAIWFADRLSRRFNANGFKNIVLAGWVINEANSAFGAVLAEKGYNCIQFGDCGVYSVTSEQANGNSPIRIFRDAEDLPLCRMAVSEDMLQRGIYDRLYSVLKGTVAFEADEIAEIPEPVNSAEPEIAEIPEPPVNEPEISEPEGAPSCKECADGRVYIGLQEGEKTEESEKSPQTCKRCCRKLTNKQKLALAGAGVAALLGVAYIMRKSRKDK